MIKIYSLTTTYPESKVSTKPGFVHTLNCEFAKMGIKTTVICPHTRGARTNFEMDSVQIRFFKYLPEKLEINQSIPDVIKTISGKIKTSLMIVGFFIYSLGVCLRDKDYIFHGHWAFPGGYLAYLLSKILRKKFIVTVHGSEIPMLQRINILKKITVNGLNKSHKIFASNQFLQDKLIEMGVDKKKIALVRPIPNFIIQNYTKTELEEYKKKFSKPSDKIILFVGRLTEIKGTEFLLRAVPHLKSDGFHLVIVGDGVLREQLVEIAKSLEIQDMVTFFGPANTGDLAKIYGIADVFVLPSIITDKGVTEGTGLVILEAMYFGIPIVASAVGGIPETVKNEYNGLLVPHKDPKEIALAIQRIFSDSVLREKMVKNAQETIKEFLPGTVAQKYLKEIQNLN